ncbi:hypothetical protein D9M68_663090 [compost metagenome]
MRPALGHDDVLVLRRGAAVNLPAVAIRAETARLVADDHHQRLGEQHLGMVERVPGHGGAVEGEQPTSGTVRLLATRGLVVIGGFQHVDVRDAVLPAFLYRCGKIVDDVALGALGFRRALLPHGLQRADRVEVAEAFADQAAEVDASDRCQRLDAVVGHGGVNRVGTAAAHADGADALRIDVRQRDQVIDGKPDIRHTDRRVFDEAGRSAAATLKARVERDDDEAFPGQCRCVDDA